MDFFFKGPWKVDRNAKTCILISTGQTVFIVDDEPTIRQVLAKELEIIGCKVHCFSGAADCLKLLAKNDCTLIITDVKMPGMDGLALLAKIKRQTTDNPRCYKF